MEKLFLIHLMFLIFQTVNGSCSKWTCWTPCSVTCGSGNQERRRTCQTPPSAKIGPACSKFTSESKTCTLTACPIAGKWGGWKEWSMCSASCGGGHQTRVRACVNPAPANNGPDCSGSASEGRQCGKKLCPIAGKWGVWKDWSMCSVSCGGGHQTRVRLCDYPAPANNGPDCSGPGLEGRQCGKKLCPIAGMWGIWTEWIMCPVTCGGGRQQRTRLCDSPAPANDGPDCIGSSTENKQCAPSVCPINGHWGEWGGWSSCSSTACGGDGMRTRTRRCNNPAPANNGLTCKGKRLDTESCEPSWCS